MTAGARNLKDRARWRQAFVPNMDRLLTTWRWASGLALSFARHIVPARLNHAGGCRGGRTHLRGGLAAASPAAQVSLARGRGLGRALGGHRRSFMVGCVTSRSLAVASDASAPWWWPTRPHGIVEVV